MFKKAYLRSIPQYGRFYKTDADRMSRENIYENKGVTDTGLCVCRNLDTGIYSILEPQTIVYLNV